MQSLAGLLRSQLPNGTYSQLSVHQIAVLQSKPKLPHHLAAPKWLPLCSVAPWKLLEVSSARGNISSLSPDGILLGSAPIIQQVQNKENLCQSPHPRKWYRIWQQHLLLPMPIIPLFRLPSNLFHPSLLSPIPKSIPVVPPPILSCLFSPLYYILYASLPQLQLGRGLQWKKAGKYCYMQ